MQNNLVFAKMLGVLGINRNDEKVAELLKANGIKTFANRNVLIFSKFNTNHQAYKQQLECYHQYRY